MAIFGLPVYLTMVSFKPEQGFSSKALYQGSRANLLKTSFPPRSPCHTVQLLSLVPCTVPAKQCFWRFLASRDLEPSKTTSRPGRARGKLLCPSSLLHVPSCWPSRRPLPLRRLLSPMTLPELLRSSPILPTRFC